MVHAASAEEAARHFRRHSFRAVIIGQAVPTEEKPKLIRAARAAASAPWIIGVYKLAADEAAGAHVAVDSHDGPQALLSALRRFAPSRAQTQVRQAGMQ